MKKLIAITALFMFAALLPPAASAQYYDPYYYGSYNPYYSNYGGNYYGSSYYGGNYVDPIAYARPYSNYNSGYYDNNYYPSYGYYGSGTYPTYSYGNYYGGYDNSKNASQELRYVTDLDGNIIGEYSGTSTYRPDINDSGSYTPNYGSNRATVTVEMTSNKYSPSTITIKKGSTVKWVNRDHTSHTVTGDKSSSGISSSTMSYGNIYTKTFNSTGTFSYHDKYRTTMKGKVIVK